MKLVNGIFKMTSTEYEELVDEMAGGCLACGEMAFGVEPDARQYKCDDCEARKVYGLEELLLMGLIVFVEEGDEDEDSDE